MRTSLLIMSICSATLCKSQVFNAGDLIPSLSYGTFRGSFDQQDTAGYSAGWEMIGTQFPLRIEFGIADRLSVNLSYTYTSWGKRYFSRFEKHNWIDVGPGISYHIPLQTERMDFVGEIEFGYARYHIEDYDTSNFSSKTQGVFIRGGISPRIYFTKEHRLGALAYYRFSYYFMGGSEYDGANPQWEYDLRGYSQSYGVGLFYRIGSAHTSSYIDNPKNQ